MMRGQPLWPRFLPTRWVVNLATLGPVGRVRRGPGTAGSVAGLLYFTMFFAPLPAAHSWWLTVVMSLPALYLAVAICGEAEFRLGQRDPGGVVLDEFVVMPLCFLGWQWLPAEWVAEWRWAIFLGGFTLFRLFDIAKPLGISRLQNLPGGWGVVADDVAAALATSVTLHAAGWAWMTWA
ncbi:MAG: phosphatidylglycerophosphatase A [Burkholderiales bacterium]|nr:phosphatidylglycerophosphatase A [Opitutaceae bacterium]